MTATAEWLDAQKFEREWWGDCVNTFQEESKQLDAARLMGLEATTDRGRWPVYDLHGRSVVDIGGGPVSLLLKTIGGKGLQVVDPCPYPTWVWDRYRAVGITVIPWRAEDWQNSRSVFDEAWIYNTLQHASDPEEVVMRARCSARLVRLFEWVDVEASPGHPHVLRSEDLARWLGGTGREEFLPAHHATAFYGVFPS